MNLIVGSVVTLLTPITVKSRLTIYYISYHPRTGYVLLTATPLYTLSENKFSH